MAVLVPATISFRKKRKSYQESIEPGRFSDDVDSKLSVQSRQMVTVHSFSPPPIAFLDF